jgi:predicted amidophosphoribosyltransferase
MALDGYSFKWAATCPRCSKRSTQDDFTCANCGQGHILKSNDYGWGCPVCKKTALHPKCTCGTDIAGVSKKSSKLARIFLNPD